LALSTGLNKNFIVTWKLNIKFYHQIEHEIKQIVL